MEVKIYYELNKPTMSLEEFAEMHGLNLIIRERNEHYGDNDFVAAFEHVATNENNDIIRGVGETPYEAMKNYADAIAEKSIYVDNKCVKNHKHVVRVILVPTLTYSEI